jgi:hypothetical protein
MRNWYPCVFLESLINCIVYGSSWNIILENLIVFELVRDFHAFYGTQNLLPYSQTVAPEPYQTLPWLRPIVVIIPPRKLEISLWKFMWNLCRRIWHWDRAVSEYFGIKVYLRTNYRLLFHSFTTENTNIK